MTKLICVLSLLSPLVCLAQTSSVPGTEIALGGAYLRAAPGANAKTVNLGGFDVSATKFVTRRIGLTANVRGYFGSADLSGNGAPVAVRTGTGITNPFVSEYTFVAGPQVRIVNRRRLHTGVRALFGAVDGVFDKDLQGLNPASVGLYNNQTTFAGQFGGVLDFDLSQRIALRATPGLLLTHFNGSFQKDFGVGVAAVFRFGGK